MNAVFPSSLTALLLPIRLNALGLFFINFLIPLVAHQTFHANGWQMGLLFSLQAAGTGIGAVCFGGLVAREASRRYLISLGSLLKGIGYALIYLAIVQQQFTLMVVATALLGFGAGMFWLVWQTCFAERSALANRAEVFGEASRQIGLGVLWGSVFAFTLMTVAEDYGQPHAVAFAVLLPFAFCSTVAAWLSWRAVTGLSAQQGVTLLGADSGADDGGAAAAGGAQYALVVVLFSLIFIGQLSGALVAPFLEVYLLDELNITSLGDLTIAYIPGGIISMMVAPQLGRLADKFNPAYVLSLAAVLGALTTFTMLQVNELWQISVLFVIDASVITTSALVLTKLVSQVGGEQSGRAFGWQGFVGNAGAISGPLLGGMFWQLQGAAAPLYFSIATETGLALCCVLLLAPLCQRVFGLAKASTEGIALANSDLANSDAAKSERPGVDAVKGATSQPAAVNPDLRVS